MSEPSDVFLPHGGYRKLRSYRLAEVVFDATVVFCDRFIRKGSRTHDQMVQAARSGVRNISEGSGLAATSRKLEMNLTNVARASLSDELLPDFESFLRQIGLELWPKDSRKTLVMRERLRDELVPGLPPAYPDRPRCDGLANFTSFIAHTDAEVAANAMICLIHQTIFLLRGQLRSQEKTFLNQGGFSENLLRQRQNQRRKD
ncbi:MAG: four helix bundle suffix domain-containing protein [Verrucomicrobiales bacterium]